MLACNDKILESISAKINSFSSVVKEQIIFNKKVELQLAQLASTLPIATNLEKVKAITTRGGKSTRDPPYPKGAGKTPVVVQAEAEKEDNELLAQEHELQQDFRDTTLLPFLHRNRKVKMDEQFDMFVEVIQKLYINIPLLDAIQVPTYAKYLQDILNNKRPLPSTEVIELTEECSAAILNTSPVKKKDLGCLTINCSIGSQNFENALFDLGASVSVMPKKVFDKLNYSMLTPTLMCLRLADQSVCYPIRIAENILIKIQKKFIPIDFVVLDMQEDMKTPLILRRPFLSTTNAHIDVRVGEIKFNINEK
jgi:hypothetical protein